MKRNTKLGLQNSILVAAIYLSGNIAPVIMFGLIIYTLLFEEDKFSRLSAKRATVIYILFATFYGILNVFDTTIRIFANEIGTYNVAYSKVSYLLSLAECLCFLVMAVRAFLTQDTNPGALDNKVDDILNSGVSSAVTQYGAEEEKQEFVFCANCGAKMSASQHFCDKCGSKMES